MKMTDDGGNGVAKILQRVITMRLQLMMMVVVHMQMIIMIVMVTVYQM